MLRQTAMPGSGYQHNQEPRLRRSQPSFAPLVVEGPFEERHVGDGQARECVVRTDAAIDGSRLSAVIHAVRASR